MAVNLLCLMLIISFSSFELQRVWTYLHQCGHDFPIEREAGKKSSFSVMAEPPVSKKDKKSDTCHLNTAVPSGLKLKKIISMKMKYKKM